MTLQIRLPNPSMLWVHTDTSNRAVAIDFRDSFPIHMLIKLDVGLKNKKLFLQARYSDGIFGYDYVSFVYLCKHEVKKANE